MHGAVWLQISCIQSGAGCGDGVLFWCRFRAHGQVCGAAVRCCVGADFVIMVRCRLRWQGVGADCVIMVGAADGVVGAGFVIIMVSCGVWGRGVVVAQISRLWSGAGATSC